MKFLGAAMFGLLATVYANDCISNCETTAASDLGCSVDNLSGCFCAADFVKEMKECLGSNSSCGKEYVASYYSTYDSVCATATATSAAASTATGTATSTAAESTGTSDCIATCESTAASELGCSSSNLAGCFCTSNYTTEMKACLGSSCGKEYVASFYSTYDSVCATVSATGVATTSGASAATTTTAATSTYTGGANAMSYAYGGVQVAAAVAAVAALV
ncbi:hypothetical protein ASPZODRAFT_24914 [Penicilliopsis zonata CBS 506.65]|uniref:CFEM domain-containing protein n=1 Tax=Penicilliopsis zonata CBS 506.65 TaxID=1073090 RepID=A0A1L9SLM9_9EURO|nr:hypothetical protein ASPZODRAFT_24914 [Penicilliopsis zonata CBS 506.65]OJJ48043.1 hypothetical protein ASPZODRAFT_24914 [Penicilliopsis zonata CBS 506.65]